MRTDGKIIIGTEVDSEGIDNWLNDLPDKTKQKVNEAAKEGEQLTKKYEELIEKYKELTTHKKGEPIFESDVKEAEKLKSEIISIVKQMEKLTGDKITVPGITEVDKKLPNINKGLKKVTSSIVKWSLALFGVRTIFGFISSSVNKIASNDPQLKADIDYMKNALAYTIEPIVRSIVDLAKKLLQYLGYIVYQWTDKNIFENAKKSLDQANKSAKQLQKTTAGFDEINVLSDNSSSSSANPSFSLDAPENVKPPEWIEWIANNKDVVIGAIAGITAALISLKLLGLDPILSLEIGLLVAGIAMLISDIVDFISDPSWQGFVNILGDIAIIIGAIMLLMGNWWGLLVVVIGAIVKLVADNWDTIMDVLGGIGGWIYDHVIKPVTDVFTGLWDGIKKAFTSVWNFIMKAFSKGGKIFSGLKDGIVNVFKTVVNALISGLNKLIRLPFDSINKMLNTIRNVSFLGVAPFKGLWKENPLPVPQLPKLARGGIVNNPGPGVMMGSYIAGERGPEAVLPLTDDTLQKLANMIPITVNVTNSMNGRVISRELQRVQNNQDFAYNR